MGGTERQSKAATPDGVSLVGKKRRTRQQTRITDAFRVSRRSRATLEEKSVSTTKVARKNAHPKRRRVTVSDSAEAALSESITSASAVVADDHVVEAGIGKVDVESKSAQGEAETEEKNLDVAVTELVKGAADVLDKKVALEMSESSNVALSQIKTTDDVVPFSSSKAPAFERFAHLVDHTLPLALPAHFTLLQRLMSAVDNMLMLAKARDQVGVVFDRVKGSLEMSLGRRVEFKMISALCDIIPNCYVFRPVRIVLDGRKTDSQSIELDSNITHSFLYDRKMELTSRMLDIVTAKHAVFLESIGKVLPAKARLVRWHPDFALDQCIDGEYGQISVDVPSSGGDCHDDAIEKVPEDSAVVAKSKDGSDKKLSLLERIRAKQKQAEVDSMAVDVEKEQRMSENAALVQFSGTVAALFSQLHGKSTLLMGDAVNRIVQGSKAPISCDAVIQQLEQLTAAVPHWIRIVQSSSNPMIRTIKVDRSVSFQTVKALLMSRMADTPSDQ